MSGDCICTTLWETEPCGRWVGLLDELGESSGNRLMVEAARSGSGWAVKRERAGCEVEDRSVSSGGCCQFCCRMLTCKVPANKLIL
jgi:hypothetical protein